MRILLLLIALLLLGCQRPPEDLDSLIQRSRAGEGRALELLVQRLGQEVSEQRDRAYKALIELGRPAVPLLLARLPQLGGEELEYCVAVLGNLRAEEAVAPLGAMLRGRTEPRRQIAAWALGEIGGEGSVAPLILALEDENEQVRRAATRALVKLNRSAVPRLLETLPRLAPQGQGAAIRALGDIGDGRALESLLAAARGPVRGEALLALGKLKDSRAEATLIAALSDADWNNRLHAVMALGTAGSQKAVPSLETSLNDEVEVVREWSARTLEILTGKRHGYLNSRGEETAPYSLYH